MSERKSLSYLIEAEMEKATVMMAAKGITEDLQQMAEKIAMMVAKDVMPLDDAMREAFGQEAAKAFQTALSEKLTSLVTTIADVKDAISAQISSLESGTPVEGDLATDDVDDLFADDGEDAEMGDEEFQSEAPSEERSKKDDDMDNLDDIFADADDAMGASGRGMKEGAVPYSRKITESSDSRIAREFSKLLREGKDVSRAARMIAETYAISVSTVSKIIGKAVKGRK